MSNEILSLKEIILRKFSVLLWSRPENLNPLMSFQFLSEEEDVNGKLMEWNTLVDQVKKQALAFNFPKVLNEELMLLIKPIGSEFIKWRSYHENYFYDFDCIPFVNLLSWTSQGVIDYCETAKNIVRQENELTLYERYMLSCLYCLEDDFPVIFEKFSDKEKRNCVENASRNPRHRELLAFYTNTFGTNLIPEECIVKEHLRCGTAYQFAFENAASTGNLVATKYFFQKLAQAEKAKCLSSITEEMARRCSFWMITFPVGYPKESYSDILCYLFTQMNQYDRVAVFKKYPYNVLRSFMDWPREKVFLDLFKAMCSDLPASDYQELLCVLVRNLSWSAYNYAQLFEKVVLYNPTLYQEFVLLNKSPQGYFLYHLLDCNDENNIRLVIGHIPQALKNQLLSTAAGFDTIWQLIMEDKLCLIEMLLEELKLSGEVRKQIKEDFRKFLERIGTGEQKFRKLVSFITILDGKATPNKKNLEE